MSEINLYACGGGGINLASNFSRYARNKTTGFAEINTYFIDTSRSNLNAHIPEECVYLVDDVDGSGKKRDSNYAILSNSVAEILHKFKPAKANIVIHSTGGGSGSTVGPIIASELLARGETVIIICIGSTSSKIEARNTLNTLRSLEKISEIREKPVVAFYRENSEETPRGQVDIEIQQAIVLLAALFSGDNRELDTADLKNFVNYTTVTGYPARLSSLEIFQREIVLSKGQALVSCVTLTDEDTSSDSNIPVEYQAVGFLSEKAASEINSQLPLHTCVVSGTFKPIVEKLEASLKEYDGIRNATADKPIIDASISSTKEGLIL